MILYSHLVSNCFLIRPGVRMYLQKLEVLASTRSQVTGLEQKTTTFGFDIRM